MDVLSTPGRTMERASLGCRSSSSGKRRRPSPGNESEGECWARQKRRVVYRTGSRGEWHDFPAAAGARTASLSCSPRDGGRRSAMAPKTTRGGSLQNCNGFAAASVERTTTATSYSQIASEMCLSGAHFSPSLLSTGHSPSSMPKGRASRTLPNRECVNVEVARLNFTSTASTTVNHAGGGSSSLSRAGVDPYSVALAQSIFAEDALNAAGGSVLKIHLQERQQPGPGLGVRRVTQHVRAKTASAGAKAEPARTFPQVAERVLDAPCIVDDFHLSLIDWSSWANILAVSLNDTVYTWDAVTGVSNELLSLEDESNPISNVTWIQEGGVLAVASSATGNVKLWDVSRGKSLRQMDGHTDRVCAMAWNQHVLTTASRDGTIVHHDVRVRKHIVSRLRGVHNSEVCKLAYSPDFSAIASSDDDGTVAIWDSAPSVVQPIRKFSAHDGPVAALDWVPTKRHTLCTGGYGDKCLKIHKTNTGEKLFSVETDAEITSLLWSQHTSELVTSSGHPSDVLTIWNHTKGDKLKKLADVKGH
eukprot:gene293-414_t